MFVENVKIWKKFLFNVNIIIYVNIIFGVFEYSLFVGWVGIMKKVIKVMWI